MGVAIVIAIFVGGVILALYATSRRLKRVKAAWSMAASELGLRHEGGGWTTRPALTGELGRLQTRVDVYSTGSKNKSYWTRYRVEFPEKGQGVRLKRQTGLSRITKLFGAQDIEIGDSIFDKAFVIKADSDQKAGQFLTLARRTVLLRLFSLYREVNATEDHIEVVTGGYEEDPDAIVTNARRVVSVGRVLAGISKHDRQLGGALESRLMGDMASAVEELRGAAATNDDIDGPLLAAEAMAQSGQLEEAAPLLADLAVRLPADEEVAGLRRALGRMEPSRPAADTSPVSMREMLDDLFVSNRLSFETAELFDEHYLERDVSWSGRVKSVRAYRRDLDFGSTPGTKATVAIAEVEHDLYGIAQIDAVVQLPADAAQEIRRGDQIDFTGRLLKADSMMRNVYVKDGRLV